MLFVELKFFAFFAIVLLVYWNLAGNSARKNFLLCASYFFYGSWDWRFAVMLFFISSMDYVLARAIDQTSDDRRRLLYVILSLSMNLGVLGYFKYTNFFIDSTIASARWLGFDLPQYSLNIILPIGISFVTFQSLSYTIDVYRRQLKPARKLRDYLLFATFFPQLVAGPIVRPAYFLPQLTDVRRVDAAQVREYALLFLIGFIKKTAIADNLAPYVDQVFNAPEAYSRAASISATWLYATQIYCDFSGYTDMAIAVAGLLGFRLVINFNAPYLACSIQDFWRRWHISLSTWIRDYIYISLGGRSHRLWLTYRNLLVTMLLGGLWHGAAWTFVVWGGLHGAALVVNHEYNRLVPRKEKLTTTGRLVGWFLTINFVCAAWIFFRATTFDKAWIILQRYLLLDAGGPDTLPAWLLAVPPALLLIQFLSRRYQWAEKLREAPEQVFVASYGAAMAVAVSLLPLSNRPFIYFQF
jgi:alginate O-acetyltransferase complex protein AlgI